MSSLELEGDSLLFAESTSVLVDHGGILNFDDCSHGVHDILGRGDLVAHFDVEIDEHWVEFPDEAAYVNGVLHGIMVMVVMVMNGGDCTCEDTRE